MPKGTPRPIPEVLDSISKKSQGVRDAAEGLKSRIVEFEELLAKLPGRTEVFCSARHPDHSPNDEYEISLVVAFRHQGKGWQLSYGFWREGDEGEPIDYKPLVDAPLKFKLAAMDVFPNLLEAMDDEHDKLVTKISTAVTSYDQMVVPIKRMMKGGK